MIKRIIATTVIVVMCITVNSIAVQRKVVGELFTNTSCMYCAAAEAAMNQIIENHADDFMAIRYHVWWPSENDPFYLWNPAPVQARNNYYGNNYTPHLFVDGVDRGSSHGAWDYYITMRAEEESPLDIFLNGSYNPDTREVELAIRINALDSIPFSDLRLFYGITESNIYYDAPNGIDWHHQTFREFLSPDTGQAVSYHQGNTYVYEIPIFILNQEYASENAHIWAFVQDYSMREILQGEIENIEELGLPELDVSVEMLPNHPPIEVPQGGSFRYHGSLINNTLRSQVIDVWIMLNVPGYGMYGPIERFDDVLLYPGQFIQVNNIRQDIPNFAPLGVYDYISYCGDYPSIYCDSTSFQFTVVQGRHSPNRFADSWNLSGWFDNRNNSDPPQTSSQPLHVENNPNPFNAATTVTYRLNDAGNVNLSIYNLSGRKVASLENGYKGVGVHSVYWDASNHSSGIYFYRLEVGESVITKRMTLLK